MLQSHRRFTMLLTAFITTSIPLVFTRLSATANVPYSADDLETALRIALRNGEIDKAEKISTSIRELSKAERQALKIRVRPGAFEFRFQGKFPQRQFSADMMEYVVATAGERDHETLVAADAQEMERLRLLGQAISSLTAKGKRITLRVKLLWNENNVAHIEDLWDLLRLEDSKLQRRFIEQLTITSQGLGAMNRQADVSMLPKQPVSMSAIVTVVVENE